MAKSGRLASSFSWAAWAGLLWALWPQQALAWGPLAHLSFSSSALESLPAMAQGLRSLLSPHVAEFLYGSLAADIIVGKNLARYAVHCHNWKVGLQVFDRARGDAQRAFSLGFLAHLAVDTVAHNYYVPYKIVQGFRRRASGHAYWELRYDQRLSENLWKLAGEVCRAELREHDEHLEEVLAESQVLPFALSRRLFGSFLLTARLKRWQAMSRLLARERDLSLHPEEIHECHRMAVDQIVDLLRRGADAECTRADPTGGRNLHLAAQLRTRLRREEMNIRQAEELVRSCRPAFKRAIHGRLELPALPE